jgi:hypothetical protein
VVSRVSEATGFSPRRRRHRKRGAEDGAADAEAECIDLVDAADFLHHLDRLQRTLLDVVVPTQVALLGLHVLPRNQEHGVALLHRVAHHRVFRLQVEDVVLVDAGRHHQEGPRRDRLGLRRILQELHQLVFIDHRTGCHRQVAADLEGAVVGHRDATLFQVGDQVLDALLDAETLGLHRRLDEFGIGGEEVGRRHRIDHLPRQEAHAVLGLAVGHRGRLDHAFHIVGIDQVSLAQVVIDRAFGPGRIVEIACHRASGRNLRRRLVGALPSMPCQSLACCAIHSCCSVFSASDSAIHAGGPTGCGRFCCSARNWLKPCAMALPACIMACIAAF